MGCAEEFVHQVMAWAGLLCSMRLIHKKKNQVHPLTQEAMAHVPSVTGATIFTDTLSHLKTGYDFIKKLTIKSE